MARPRASAVIWAYSSVKFQTAFLEQVTSPYMYEFPWIPHGIEVSEKYNKWYQNIQHFPSVCSLACKSIDAPVVEIGPLVQCGGPTWNKFKSSVTNRAAGRGVERWISDERWWRCRHADACPHRKHRRGDITINYESGSSMARGGLLPYKKKRGGRVRTSYTDQLAGLDSHSTTEQQTWPPNLAINRQRETGKFRIWYWSFKIRSLVFEHHNCLEAFGVWSVRSWVKRV